MHIVIARTTKSRTCFKGKSFYLIALSFEYRITIVAAERKVEALQELLVDTGDPALDRELAGHWRVLCGYRWNVLLPMRAPPSPE